MISKQIISLPCFSLNHLILVSAGHLWLSLSVEMDRILLKYPIWLKCCLVVSPTMLKSISNRHMATRTTFCQGQQQLLDDCTDWLQFQCRLDKVPILNLIFSAASEARSHVFSLYRNQHRVHLTLAVMRHIHSLKNLCFIHIVYTNILAMSIV